ncbi:TPA: hypothetical protein MI827_28595 [Klebsiella pneumoniae]|nr:hypothetical protein [Klebsiella pneumoniae]
MASNHVSCSSCRTRINLISG